MIIMNAFHENIVETPEAIVDDFKNQIEIRRRQLLQLAETNKIFADGPQLIEEAKELAAATVVRLAENPESIQEIKNIIDGE